MVRRQEVAGDGRRAFAAEGVVPIFPLPSVVFFPRTVLPLHVFEPRYRKMVRDTVDGSGLLAVALLRPGWEADYAGSPAFHAVGTLGRIEKLQPLPDGRFDLRLVGLFRVQFGELVREGPYRTVRYRALLETALDEADPSVVRAKLDLLASQGCLARELAAPRAPGIVLDESIPLEAAVNAVCASLPVEPTIRQSLLEERDLARRMRRVAALLDEVLERILRLKSLRSAGGGENETN